MATKRVTKAQLQEALTQTTLLLSERLAELELALEANGEWTRLAADSDREFSRQGLRQICRLARIFYLKNPLIQRGVNVQRDYVFGQGVTIQAADGDVDEVVQAFLADAKNQAELSSHQAMLAKEVELATSGNLFFVFFVNAPTGRVRVRTIPVDEIEEIVTNPEDAKEPWFYRRTWTQSRLDPASGNQVGESRTAYYPDWRYLPLARERPPTFGQHPVLWESPVYHVRVGGLDGMRFGVPEVYAALDWAKAYKAFLEDWATIVRAYARFAWQVKTGGGRTGIAAAKARLATTLTTGAAETNPAPVAGSTFVAGENTSLAPVRTAGATTDAEDGRRLLLMVAATFGFPETFFGDVSVGTLATAKSLDRPSELKIASRQRFWRDVLDAILGYVIYWAVKAGALAGTAEAEDDGTPRVELEVDPESGEPRSQSIEILFPPIVEHSVKETVESITLAAGGLGKAGEQAISRLLLQAIGVDDVEAAMDELYDEDGNPTKPAPAPPVLLPPGAAPASGTGEAQAAEPDETPADAEEARLLEAVRNVAAWIARERQAGHAV